jgi:thiamine kinase-like enzyme
MKKMLPWLKQDHKHVAKLLDFGDFGECYWTLIEYIPKALSIQEVDYLSKVRAAAHKRKGWYGYFSKAPLEVRKMGPDWKSLCSFLHRAKYWHGDLHAGNVRKADDGTLKLIDLESFGW